MGPARRAPTPPWTWTRTPSSSGLTGATFADQGATLSRFVDDETADADHYFTDADPSTRQDLSDTGPTGANGTALMILPDYSQISGTGAGCTWPNRVGSSIPGMIWTVAHTCP